MVNRKISLLSKETIDQIAAGEVVERPCSVVKELVENAIDADANAITIEIKDGGTSYIRITDNGCGIPKEDLQIAFLRHATSKIESALDLNTIQTLGFRGEALSSISAVSHVEIITKTASQFMGCRYVLEGSEELSLEDVGAPDGTTIMVYQLFYNTPARKKFLKSPTTEANYISELVERLALSHPNISFSFISNGKEKLHTSGNGNLKDAIYQIYGRELTSNLLPVYYDDALFEITGFIGNSYIARGNRLLETFFIDGRYIKSAILSKAIEEGYKGYLMQHQYPFCVLFLNTKSPMVDVNVHPTKQEVRFDHELEIASCFTNLVLNALTKREDILKVEAPTEKTEISDFSSFSTNDNVTNDTNKFIKDKNQFIKDTNHFIKDTNQFLKNTNQFIKENDDFTKEKSSHAEPFEKHKLASLKEKISEDIRKDTPYEPQYQAFYEQKSFLSQEAKAAHKIIGQVFDTYWLVEYNKELYIIDQHAAHEKVLYEKTMKALEKKEMTSQLISPPIIISLSTQEQVVLETYLNAFEELGYQVSSFGGNEFALTAIPANVFSLDPKQMFMEILDECQSVSKNYQYEFILEKIASMSCKAAVKGNNKLSRQEVEILIDELLQLDNPYHCPHGRPTIISMTQQELEKKFKRII